MANIVRYTEVTSTNDVAKNLALKEAPHFTCVVASRQTAGRGRRGKVWTTLPDKSIACSIILRKEVTPLLPLMASLCVHDVISKYTKCDIKWPNDVLINGKKISGILAERIGRDGDAFYILGVGINVKKFEKPELGDVLGTSIENETGSSVSLEDVLTSLIDSLKKHLMMEDSDLLKSYRDKCATIGHEVTWVSDSQTLTGTAKEITHNGSLILNVNGCDHEIMSGEIVAQGSKV
tara:strand:- start:5756 stop:6460 length:705 start_codon:yes stop_codon:yes gene_type:complete